MANRGVVVSKAQILAEVWGPDHDGTENVVELYVGYLRRKLDDGHPPADPHPAGSRLRPARRAAVNRLSLRWMILVPAPGHDRRRLRGVRGLHRPERPRDPAGGDRPGARTRRAWSTAARARRAGPPFGRDPTGPASRRRHVGVEPPVQLVVSTDGGVMSAQDGENPFSRDTLARPGAATRERTDHRGRRLPRPGVAAARRAGPRDRPAPRGLPRRHRRPAANPDASAGWSSWRSSPRWHGGWPEGWSARWQRWRPRPTGSPAERSTPRCQVPAAPARSPSCRRDIERMVARLRAALAERELAAAAATRAHDDMNGSLPTPPTSSAPRSPRSRATATCTRRGCSRSRERWTAPCRGSAARASGSPRW